MTSSIPSASWRRCAFPVLPVVLLMLTAGVAAGSSQTYRVGWGRIEMTVASATDTVIALPEGVVVTDSLHLTAGALPLGEGYDYTVDHAGSRIVLRRQWPVAGTVIALDYRALPLDLPTSYTWMTPPFSASRFGRSADSDLARADSPRHRHGRPTHRRQQDVCRAGGQQS